MPLPRPKKQPLKMCCWCFLLKAGAMFIGVAEILRGTFYLILGSEIAKENFVRHDYALAIGISTAIIGGASPVFGIILILAAIYELPRLLLPTLFYSVIFLFANIVAGGLFVAVTIILDRIPDAVFSTFIILLSSAWEAHAMVVVYSFYLELTQIHRDKKESGMLNVKRRKHRWKSVQFRSESQIRESYTPSISTGSSFDDYKSVDVNTTA